MRNLTLKTTSLLTVYIALGVVAPLRADVFQMPAGLKSLEFVEVGDPGNAPDKNGFGAVPYRYRISKYETTAAQWVEFLNAKGLADPSESGLWSENMSREDGADNDPRCDIRRAGKVGSFVHTVSPEFANRPVNYASFLDACRFCNWLHNGQGDGDTETGAYTLNGYNGRDGRRIQRNPGAKFFVPTEDEWYKAAYYDPKKPGGPGYWKYPTRSDTKPSRVKASANAANYYTVSYLDPYFLLEVGSFPRALSAYGTLDQAGNLAEWTEGLNPPLLRSLRGGAFNSDDAGLNVPTPNRAWTSMSDENAVGIRIAAAVPGFPVPVPEPKLLATESAVVDFPRRPWRDPQNGKPFFPLAWFSHTSNEADLDELKRQGANLILVVESYSDVETEEEFKSLTPKMVGFLDQAHKRNIRVLIQAGNLQESQADNNAVAIEWLRQWVKAIRNHPALFGYQLYDEPEYRVGAGIGVEERRSVQHFVDSFMRARQELREWDPNPHRMISVVFNLVPLSTWTDFLPSLESFQIDRYPLDVEQAYFGHRGDWGPLMMAWSMAHGANALKDHPHLKNPAPCMQGVGQAFTDGKGNPVWRTPLYEESRYMAYSSLTTGAWGVFHWIHWPGFPPSPTIDANVGRLYHELRTLLPAFEQSYENPPFTVRHNHEGITRDFLTDAVADITTLALEDEKNYYLVVSDNSGVFKDVTLRLKGLKLANQNSRPAEVLNESWEKTMTYAPESGEWVIGPHAMSFGDINVWVISKESR
ncbi:MAG: formylglycine-generating enzyme family protein [Verrucomicrobia bacterium]|nr:formylglycine-generating enzyme family protein [Verrucomicrobiota bacterium]